jgi:hypothetical protein
MDDKLPDKLTEQLVAGFLVQAVREGLIDPRGKSEDELEREFLAYLKDVSDEEGEFLVVTDFTGAFSGKPDGSHATGRRRLLACSTRRGLSIG